jgi:hypothetical protein
MRKICAKFLRCFAKNAQNLCKNFALFCAQAQNFARFARFLRDFKLLCAVLFCAKCAKTAQNSAFCANSQRDAHPCVQ